MQNDIISQSINAGKVYLQTTQELADINKKTVKTLIDLQFSFFGLNIENNIECAELLTGKRTLAEMLSEESDFASEYSIKLLETARQMDAVLTDSKQELSAWVEKTIAASTEATRKAA